MTRHPASDEVIVWLESLSGMLTQIDTKYGGIAELVEHPDWDENRTSYACKLIRALHARIRDVDLELSDHVQGKHHQD